MRDALVAALHLHIFNAHNDRVRMANIAQTVNVLQAVILTDEEKMLLTPTYHVFEMFKVHQDAVRLDLEVRAPDYAFENQVVPGVSASASRNRDGIVHLTLCHTNPNQAVELTCRLRGLAAKEVSGRLLTSDAMTAHNTFTEPDRIRPVAFEGAVLSDDGDLRLTLPAMSVVVLKLL
jgi:alpha-N-arabinofuranosidase